MSLVEVLRSFLTIIPDIAVQAAGIFGHFLFMMLSPLLHLIGLLKTKQFPEAKTIVITGASSGIGRELALQYAGRGKVLGLTGRDKARLEEVAKLCRDKGAVVETTTIQVTEADAMERWLTKFDQVSPVDIVIANAGVGEATLPRTLTYEERARQVVDVNVNGVLNTVLPLLQRMRDRSHGQIVIVGSLSTYITHAFPAYVGSKGFTHCYAATLRQELRKHGIGVTYISPGFVDTRMTRADKNMKKPMMKTAEASAQAFKQGISENRAFVTDNLPTMLTAYILSCVPMTLRDGWDVIMNAVYSSGCPDTLDYSSNSSSSSSASSTTKKDK
ncbi:hypothetical protein SAMD00019534_072680 [Acytostelium subglobosum LB1]|uniref:hypothetical protein n=1 Tax=Acytostelium subglobosum LB1 TaxID=1410327 RepID=UPI000644CACD|nr:hypothetical protein SAMD00019534_072680 [Acytostelium subglobosum LB1]GAM24093.1 hypothetical protein SAMD00019534_072680 [Acytostelium subglobosum LB1]|eukprot:XP_012753129.1 hypothetical protein SAMD00019534_072680 [Acytostelium subglobosum LB1]